MSSGQNLLLDQMKSAMRRLGASVNVITCFDGKTRFAMTASSVTSLSLDPPAILVCVNRDTGLHNALSDGHDFCVNALHSHQQEISENCAWKKSGEARFDEGVWKRGINGTPYLSDAQSTIMCSMDGSHDYGSHSIFIGKVRTIRFREEVAPLMFLDGKYFTP